MAEPEDGQLEFKRTVLGRKEIGEYAVGIGNTGGGWLFFGITDRRPRRIVGADLPADGELQRIRDSVLDFAGVAIDLGSIETAEGTVLAVRIPGRARGQLYQTKTGKFLMRTGEGLRAMPLAEIERIRTEELETPDWSAEIVPGAWQDVADPVELSRLRRILSELHRDELVGLDDEALLRSLELLVRRKGRLSATRAAVLMVGRPESVREHAPHHEAKLQRFDRDELVPDLSEDTRAPLLAVVQRVAELIEAVNSIESFQAGLFRIDVPKFPRIAYREALVNALAHRDYQRSGNVAVRVYSDRLEIASPGGWFGGVSERNILTTESHRRNELLAAVLQRVGLAERSALGVKRMFREMLSMGKRAPEYRSSASSVTVALRNGTFDRAFATLARQASDEGPGLSVFDLVILSHLRTHREVTSREAATLCQRSEADARRILDELRNRGLIDRTGEGRARRYVLGAVAYDGLGLAGDRPLDLGMSERTFEGLLIDELERRGEAGLTPREIREWSRYGRSRTSRLLAGLVERGVIVSSGLRGRGARYWLPRFAPGPMDEE